MSTPLEPRSALPACALRLFATHGYDAVGVQQIVEAAGVTKPTLYHHFGSKLGLLERLLADGLGPLHAGLAEAAAYQGDVAATLAAIARKTFAFAQAHPDLYRLYLSLWFAPPASEAYRAALPWHERHFAMIEAVFAAAVADHGTMAGRQRAYAATFLGMINNYASFGLNGVAALDESLVNQSIHQFMHGIFS
ncbi:TetR/AcrR family transcriptional regulator [Rhodoplanes sp. TEM]|uniref:TetR/AcrR family transcriptional regulator n=1 Tax=Rhodoplanes tepidamans TaxID=200616 RepID=A0ABT5JJR0_RHOTP|nr:MULTISPECIES: TetR/AcrR family transcriptional regulator [Rhodoplanes]MDC7789245.1 TetR/AcrR family transcriptional regulator [Rhodoplanes tepidamans]MDC7985817.1 TetR/AcrR family transcriptional regulator [Rhodoplanes sp. TEM]MDQ0358857.1 TetR/AcrR family transcriptional regulator [Rhodoplanes tepidamans]